MRVSPPRFRTFVVLWSGQFLSLTGSALSNFALGVHAYQRTGSVTTLGFVYALAFLPFLLASPFTGALVDRWGPGRALVVSNAAALAVMLTLSVVLVTGTFETWHLYLVVSAISVVGALQTPAFETAIPALVTARSLGRANGMRMVALAASRLLAPVSAGFLLGAIHISGIVLLDCVSYVLALLTLAAVRIPGGRITAAPVGTPSALLADFAEAWRHIAARRGLLALLVFSALVNFFSGFVELVVTPLVLSFASSEALGTVMSFAGIGMLAAGVAMSVWGGPRRRVAGVLGFSLLMGLATIAGGLRPDVTLVAVAAFFVLGGSAVVVGCNQLLWQTKVDPRLLGRTMALLGMVFSAPQLLAYALAGLTADHVFEPLAGSASIGGRVAEALVGAGPGRGFALLIMSTGLLIVLCALAGALYRPLRRLDTELPDLNDDQAGGEERPGESEERSPALPVTTKAEQQERA